MHYEYLEVYTIELIQKIILYGVSRGSATVFNYYALNNNDRIAAVVCEGIFDSVANIGVHGNWLARCKNRLVQTRLTQFKMDGMCRPEKTLNSLKVDYEKPLALITSLADKEVPYQCTVNLYRNLLKKDAKKFIFWFLKNHRTQCIQSIQKKKNTETLFMHFINTMACHI